ncbi:hypothetical protein Tcan_00551, partial [Toxocara canis]
KFDVWLEASPQYQAKIKLAARRTLHCSIEHEWTSTRSGRTDIYGMHLLIQTLRLDAELFSCEPANFMQPRPLRALTAFASSFGARAANATKEQNLVSAFFLERNRKKLGALYTGAGAVFSIMYGIYCSIRKNCDCVFSYSPPNLTFQYSLT